MVDRLKDLNIKGVGSSSSGITSSSSSSSSSHGVGGEVEFNPITSPSSPSSPPSSSGATSSGMDSFFDDVDSVKSIIAVIKAASQKVRDIDQEAILATTRKQEEDLSDALDAVISDTNKKALLGKTFIKKMEEAMAGSKKNNSSTAADMRIKENLMNTLKRKYVEVMKDYQAAQTKYKTDIKAKCTRQVQLAQPDATPEEIEAVFQSGSSGDVMKQTILKGDASESIRNAYETVQGKYEDVLKLESSVNELHQMFLDFSLVVDQQSALLDQIEYQVKASGDFIDQGNADLGKAIEYQISIRKKQCCLLVTLLIVVAIIVGVLVAKYKKKKASSSSS